MVPWAPKVVRPGFFYEEDWGSSPFARRILGSQISDDLSLAVTDTFHLPRREPRTRRRSTALGVQIVSVPTNDEPLWSAGSDGSMWLGNTSVFQLHKVTHDGDTVLTIEMRRPAEPIDRAARDSLARALGFPARLIPSHKRVMGPYDVALDGRIWVRQPDAVALQAWEVFDAEGLHLGRAMSPVPLARIPVPSFGHGTITGVTEDALGVVRKLTACFQPVGREVARFRGGPVLGNNVADRDRSLARRAARAFDREETHRYAGLA